VRWNRLCCERVGALHGPNPETHAETALAWSVTRTGDLSVGAAFDFLWTCQHRGPFLFENAGAFAEVARQVAQDVFRALAAARRKALVAGVADYVAGGLERTVMVELVEGLWNVGAFRPGTRVKTLRGGAEGIVLRLLADGRVLWRPKGLAVDLVAPPEGLLRVRLAREPASGGFHR
jgi:hypothetical protein